MKRLYYLLWLVPCVLVLACQSDKKVQPSNPAGKAPSVEPAQLAQLAVGVHQQTATLPTGDTLRYTVSVPTGYDTKKPVPLIVVLHYGGDVTPFYGREMIDDLVTPALSSLGAVVVAPDALAGDWTSLQNEKAVIWLTQSIMRSYSIDSKKVLLTGYSMGGKGTWFIGSRNQNLFTAAIPVAGEPAGGLDWKIPVYVIHSRKDEVIPIAPARRHVDQLKAKGVNAEFKEVANLTHYQTPEYAASLKGAIPWLQQVWK